jgi:hypothetical protein
MNALRATGAAILDEGQIGVVNHPRLTERLGWEASGLDERLDAAGRDAETVGGLRGGDLRHRGIDRPDNFAAICASRSMRCFSSKTRNFSVRHWQQVVDGFWCLHIGGSFVGVIQIYAMANRLSIGSGADSGAIRRTV